MVSVALTGPTSEANASAAVIVVIRRIDLAFRSPSKTKIGGEPFGRPRLQSACLLRGDLRLAVAQTIDRAVPVVGDQHRPILQLHHVDRPADILVVLQEAGDDWLDILDRAVLVEVDEDDVPAELLGPIPRAVTRDD